NLVCGTVSDVRLYPRMGKLANVSLCVSIFAVGGRLDATRDKVESTRCRVWYISTFQSKNRSISASPRLVIDRTDFNPGMLFMASSIGRVMVTCICSMGITPLSTPITTRGKLVSGNTAIGTEKAM